MGVEKISITTFIDLYQNYPTIDVRSEQEYEHAHIPGAVSLPLFSNEERKIVGTIYKQQSREAAIKKGLEFFGPKMKDIIVFVEKLLKEKNIDSKILVIHCWRGGMRSAAIAWLLDLYGFKIYTIIGGYQAYRNWVLDQFKIDWKFNILGGYTGSGKTIILQEFEKLKIITFGSLIILILLNIDTFSNSHVKINTTTDVFVYKPKSTYSATVG